MKETQTKLIICRKCKTSFEPFRKNGIILSRYCTSCLVEKGNEKRKNQINKEKKEAKEKLKTHSEWLKDCQKIFNTYIRIRDKDKACISCGKPLTGKYDAGHFFSVGSCPNLRFNEDNVHGQCVECNQHKHGNLFEYSINLPRRIGDERYNELLSKQGKITKLTIEEIKEKIAKYKKKSNELKKSLNK